jgi:uncharacterized membrane protein YqaE (UPF0057 family)
MPKRPFLIGSNFDITEKTMKYSGQGKFHWQAFLNICLSVTGLFVIGCVLVLLGIAAYLSLRQPKRLAVVHRLPVSDMFVVLDPQPLQVSLAQTNISMIAPPLSVYLSGGATNAAVWVNGKPFKSGVRAAWELIKTGWPLWCISLGTLACWWAVNCWGRRLFRNSLEKKQLEHPSPHFIEKSKIPSPVSPESDRAVHFMS